jgi:nicotinamide-nucleotide amidase
MLKATLLSVGDELALGQTVDTNTAWMSQQLAGIGIDVVLHQTVPDDQAAIERAILAAASIAPLLVVSGGIGPTDDDLTRQALAAVLQAPLELDESWLARLHEFWHKRGRAMPEMNRIQAMIPRGATMIENTAGTAAGMFATVSGCEVFVLPGVPKEMKIMFERDVLPRVRARGGGATIASRTLHTFGLGESAVAELLGDLMARGRNPSVGTTVSGGVVSVRINARFDTPNQARDALDQAATLCRHKLGHLVYGQDDDTLPAVVNRLLIDRRATVTTAESCTGGLLAKYLTDVAGSSACFRVGFVVYHNQAKYERLGVNLEMLNVYGAVSEPVVDAMARGARRLAKATYALAISGIAGPDGGSPTKPVGTVCIALTYPQDDDPRETGTLMRTFNFPGDREMIRDRAAKMALALLRFRLLGEPVPF